MVFSTSGVLLARSADTPEFNKNVEMNWKFKIYVQLTLLHSVHVHVHVMCTMGQDINTLISIFTVSCHTIPYNLQHVHVVRYLYGMTQSKVQVHESNVI